jgi:hypothetical protein
MKRSARRSLRRWKRPPGRVHRGTTSRRLAKGATDHRRKPGTDLSHAKGAGMKTARFQCDAAAATDCRRRHPAFWRPLDFHLRRSSARTSGVRVIDWLALVRVHLDPSAALTVLRFLNEELNVHLRDEAEDLFPLLAKRCPAEDCIESAINRIRHLIRTKRPAPLARTFGQRLPAAWIPGPIFRPRIVQLLTRFAGHVRRHLVAENAILLPIARARLTRRRSGKRLSAQMRARRGLSPLRRHLNAE